MSQRLQSLPSTEYFHDPSLRTISAFALGGVFLLSINYIIKSSALQFIKHSFGSLFTSSTKVPQAPETLEEDADEKARLRRWIEETFLGPAENLDPKNLVLTLTIFAFNASLGMFGSTLIYSKGQDVLCTFSVAWGDMSAQMIRIVGFIRLSIDLRELGARQWEMYFTWFYVLGLAALMMVITVFEPGSLQAVSQLDDLALCYKQHYLQIELLASLLNFFFELYAILRLVFLLVPSFLRFRHKVEALHDIRLGKALSLLLLDLLTVVPAAKPISVAADYIPFVVGAIVVLMAFNHEQARVVTTLSRVDSIPSTRMMRIFQGGSSSSIRSPPSTRRASTSASRRSSHPQRRNIEVPPFSLAAVAGEGSKSRGLKELDIISANAALNNAGQSSNRKAYNSAVAGYTPTPPISPRRASRLSVEVPRRVKLQRDGGRHGVAQSGSFGSYSDFPMPPAGVPTVQITPVEDELGRRYKVASLSRQDHSPTSSIAHNSRERWSNNWPRREDSLSTVKEDKEFGYGNGEQSRRRSKRASKNRMAQVDSKRRSSMDAGIITPYMLDVDNSPASPVTAPAEITPIAGVLSPGGRRARAVATGVSGQGPDGLSSPRIRFGARPMRSAMLAEDTLPRRLIAEREGSVSKNE